MLLCKNVDFDLFFQRPTSYRADVLLCKCHAVGLLKSIPCSMSLP